MMMMMIGIYVVKVNLLTCVGMAPEPSFDVPLVNVTVVAGQSIVLQCSIDNLGNYKVNTTVSYLSELYSLLFSTSSC